MPGLHCAWYIRIHCWTEIFSFWISSSQDSDHSLRNFLDVKPIETLDLKAVKSISLFGAEAFTNIANYDNKGKMIILTSEPQDHLSGETLCSL